MKSVKVRVHGAGSLDVEGKDARGVLLYILERFQELEGATVKLAKRGAPKKNPVISQGAAEDGITKSMMP